MNQRSQRQKQQLLGQALELLNPRLPSMWSLDVVDREGGTSNPEAGARMMLELRGPSSTVALLCVVVLVSCEPKDARSLAEEARNGQEIGSSSLPLLVVAPWFSRRSQNLFTEAKINYFDLTGNISLALNEPVFYFQAGGSDRNPEPVDQAIAQVRGAKAGRLLRFLAEVKPPYSVSELASATSLTAGYVSRLLETLDREALIDRGPRGRVVRVDVVALLRRWAESYQVLRSNRANQFLAPNGIDSILKLLATDPPVADFAITGSFAAVRRAPVAAPSLLMIYCDDAGRFSRDLALLPTERGANVVLLEPADEGVFVDTEYEDGLPFVAPSQVVIDCLTGNGRMPAEGEALLEWMLAHLDDWQSGSINEHLSRTLVK